jgi:hypothetical protein
MVGPDKFSNMADQLVSLDELALEATSRQPPLQGTYPVEIELRPVVSHLPSRSQTKVSAVGIHEPVG